MVVEGGGCLKRANQAVAATRNTFYVMRYAALSSRTRLDVSHSAAGPCETPRNIRPSAVIGLETGGGLLRHPTCGATRRLCGLPVAKRIMQDRRAAHLSGNCKRMLSLLYARD
jgi:hypothetical protein